MPAQHNNFHNTFGPTYLPHLIALWIMHALHWLFQGHMKKALTSIYLPSSEDNHPKPLLQSSFLLILTQQIADPERQWSRHQHRQQLKADDRQICPTPPLIRLRIFLPQPTEGRGPIIRAIQQVLFAQPVHIWRREQRDLLRLSLRGERGGQSVGDEEAVPEKAALEDEVYERVEQVPDE